MLEKIFGHVSYSTLAVFGFGALVVLALVRTLLHDIKIRRLGGRAARRPTRLPFGVDFVYQGIKHAQENNNIGYWDYLFRTFGHKGNPYTVEANAGGERIILTADYENIKAILATQFNDFGKGEGFNRDWHDFLGDSIFTTDLDQWQKSRQLIRPQFIKERVSDLWVFEKHVGILMPFLKGGSGQAVDVGDLFFRFTLDAATDFLLGRSVQSLERNETAFAQAFGEVQRIQALIMRSGPLNVLIPRGAFNRHLRTINQFIEPYIEDALRLSPEELEKRTKSDHGYTFLHALASYTRDRKVIRDQIIAVLLAGRDTTACTLAWLCYELSRHPEVVARLRREIEDVVGLQQEPTYANLKNMKYLQHTLHEILRLYPVVPYNVRLALKDTTLPHGGGPDGNGPVGIPEGTPIGYSTHYMQMRSDIYPATSEKFADPLEFSPERWENWQPKIWTYIPFNGGPRICVGQQFALTEMGYTIVRILQRFNRIEYRGEPGIRSMPAEDTGRKGGAWNGKSLVERMWRSRELKMKSDIVLMPADEVKLAFYAD